MLPTDPNLEMDFTLESEKSGVIDDPAFQMLVLGDWSADGSKHDVERRKAIEVDRDNFDDVMNGLGVKLDLDLSDSRITLDFRSLDDFHPDELFKRLPQFAELRELRKRLRNSDTFNSAAREVREWLQPATPTVEPAAAEVPAASDNLLDAILAQPEGGATAPKPAISSDISKLISEVVSPHLVGVDENEQSAMVAAVDDATSALMRTILRDRRFQLLEAAWRGLFFLVRRTDTGSDLRLYILDLTKEELAEDVKADAAIFKQIAAGRNGDPFAAVFGNYAFAPSVDDVAALIRIGKAAAAVRTPFISHIRPEVLGIASLADHPDPEDWDLSGSSTEGKLWAALRDQPESQFVGLTLPRFLARLPYGSETEPAEAFYFEEFKDDSGHDDYLWANGCFAVAQLLGQTYSEFGWEFGQRFMQDISGLPLHVYKQNGQSVYQSCAEVQLSQNAAEELADHGLMPIVSFKNMDQIRLTRFQSISDPVKGLKGRWK